MDAFEVTLQAIGYHAALIRPLLPTYALLIVSAIIPIYTGAHASLSRPSSAAKAPKRNKSSTPHDEDDEPETLPKMEGLGPMDAIFLPVFAGSTLAGLYVLIKWLGDPALLSKIMNGYFSIFGTVALATLGTDVMSVLHDFVFPKIYRSLGQTWTIRAGERKAVSLPESQNERSSPLPGLFASLPLPRTVKQALWAVRDLPNHKFQVRAIIRSILHANLKVGPYAIVSALLAVAIQLYTNMIYTPWYLNNLSAFAFVYSTLQILSPTTSWTATLILGALFVYDIYFVFFTPLMVEVATKLDIPAKMLFPRPEGMSMLGLGDLVVPGMVVGFALRFDLWLFYFHKQTPKQTNAQDGRPTRSSTNRDANGQFISAAESKSTDIVKPQYFTATGHWGTRFWSAGSPSNHPSIVGTHFPKPYFHATMTGYILGLLCTLLVMQVFGHAQPALLYLVPGVMGALWGTAVLRSEMGIMWRYSEEGEEETQEVEREGRRGSDQDAGRKAALSGWRKYFFGDSRASRDAGKRRDANNSSESDKDAKMSAGKEPDKTATELSKLQQQQMNQIIHFSISIPSPPISLESEPEIMDETGESMIEDQVSMNDDTSSDDGSELDETGESMIEDQASITDDTSSDNGTESG